MKKNSITLLLLKYKREIDIYIYMYIYIYIYRINRIEQHKLESYHTQVQHTNKTHWPFFPPRVAGVHFCFFFAVPSDGGCWYYVKCEMVLCKIDGEMIMQNCGYFAKLWNEDSGDWCSMADGSGSCSELAPSFFEEMIRCRHQEHRRRWPGNPNGRLKFCKHRAYLQILLLGDHDWCFTADGSFLLKWHMSAIKNIDGNDQNRSKLCNYQNLCLRDQERPLEIIFLLLGCHHYDAIAHCFFFYHHSQLLLFSPMKNNFSTTLTRTEKPRYTYWRVFL